MYLNRNLVCRLLYHLSPRGVLDGDTLIGANAPFFNFGYIFYENFLKKAIRMGKKITGAEMVIQTLHDQGVESVFGYPGGAVLPIYDAIFQQENVKHILVRHEQGASHAAEGYARSTGNVGVLIVTSGPGATNAVTGLTDALLDSIPIVCISGQVPHISLELMHSKRLILLVLQEHALSIIGWLKILKIYHVLCMRHSILRDQVVLVRFWWIFRKIYSSQRVNTRIYLKPLINIHASKYN